MAEPLIIVSNTNSQQLAASANPFKDWQPSKSYTAGEIVVATVAVSGIGIGDLIKRNTAGTSGSTFNAGEASNWTEVMDDPDLVASLAAKANATDLTSHTGNVSNPHTTTKAQVGLGSAENTADLAKPVSTAQQTALDLKAPLASPALTGTPTAPTPSTPNNSTSLATTAYTRNLLAGATVQIPYATGGDVSTIVVSGTTYRVHTFLASGTFTPIANFNVETLVVAGGGAGGAASGAGGGAGGLLTGTTAVSGAIAVTIGAGGTGGTGIGGSGGNSVFDTITATGGGGGGTNNGSVNGVSGGSGGGATGSTGATAGTGIVGQGFAGGTVTSWTGNFQAAGGGGAGGVGGNGNGTAGTGTGGVGVSNSITGTATVYAGGGGGGSNSGGGSSGGNGGGGAMGITGTANTGGGGGGGGGGGAVGASGGSGIVIIRYPVVSNPISF